MKASCCAVVLRSLAFLSLCDKIMVLRCTDFLVLDRVNRWLVMQHKGEFAVVFCAFQLALYVVPLLCCKLGGPLLTGSLSGSLRFRGVAESYLLTSRRLPLFDVKGFVS